MEEARVVIDLKEGVIELQGPVDFVWLCCRLILTEIPLLFSWTK